MGKILYTYDEIYKYISETGNKNNFYVVVNNDYSITDNMSVKNITSISAEIINNTRHTIDFVDNSSKEIFLYLAYRRPPSWQGNEQKIACTSYIFKKISCIILKEQVNGTMKLVM